MKKLIIIILLLCSSISYSQNLGTGYRIRLLKNLNLHAFANYEASYSAVWGYTAPNGREYAILGGFLGTSFVDITDTNNIREVDFVPVDPAYYSDWREIKTYSHYAYIVSEAGLGFQIVDLQYLPDSVRFVKNTNDFSGHTISQSGPYLYVNGSSFTGFGIFDLTVNPENPIARGTWNHFYTHDSRVLNDTVWTCNMITTGRITLVDVRNKNNPVMAISWVNNPEPNSPHNIALTNDRRYALVTDETFVPSPGRLKIWNVEDLTNPIYITSFNAAPFEKADVHNVEIYNNYAFLAYYTAGVKILNISNPANPVEIGWYDTYPENNASEYDGCWGPYYFPSGKLIVSDRYRGLFVLKPDLTNPVSSLPKANFSPSNLEVFKKDSIQIIDATDGIPTNWNWTITGPEGKTSNLKNPKFAFTGVGQYTVRLRASNTFGSDSITKVNGFKVKSFPLNPFNILTPLGAPFYHVNTAQNDTGKINFTWTKGGIPSEVNYKLYFRKSNGAERYVQTGLDTFYVMRKSFLDSIAVQLGLTSDSVLVTLKVKVYNETDSLATLNSTAVIIHTNTVGIENISDIIPEEYNLYQNYPNPFNPETNIKFDLPKNGYVNLILYDITGKEILKMVNQNLQAGKYNYKLNGANLNSGIYFIRLISNDFSQTKKLILLK